MWSVLKTILRNLEYLGRGGFPYYRHFDFGTASIAQLVAPILFGDQWAQTNPILEREVGKCKGKYHSTFYVVDQVIVKDQRPLS